MGINPAKVNPDFWQGKRVFLTGHTGFKGSWLSLWLQSMGATVHGYALAPPTDPALFNEARVAEGMTQTIADIRDYSAVAGALSAFKPEIIIHMAAQPLVRYSYEAPVETYATNIMGTVHLLEAARRGSAVKAIVNVTTDKCYENKEWAWGYRENEPMGGFDPYSSSKGCSELVTAAYRQSYFQAQGVALASARAGNVIGGGDWARDRLIPDILRAFEKGKKPVIRNSQATRPWQHVLEPLSGYLVLAERLFIDGRAFAGAWNFGPNDSDVLTVGEITERMCHLWGEGVNWQLDSAQNPHESNYLKLDISKAKTYLSWQPRWDLSTALKNITTWHQGWLTGQDTKALCINQTNQFQSAANNQHLNLKH
jgi:CDP-glucose 4,6-dehydratase